MRESSELYQLSAPVRLPDLLAEHGLGSLTLGDQDWVNLVYWSSPRLVQPLPCSYNRQTDIVFLRPGTADQFHSSHACPGQVSPLHTRLLVSVTLAGSDSAPQRVRPHPRLLRQPRRAGPLPAAPPQG